MERLGKRDSLVGKSAQGFPPPPPLFTHSLPSLGDTFHFCLQFWHLPSAPGLITRHQGPPSGRGHRGDFLLCLPGSNPSLLRPSQLEAQQRNFTAAGGEGEGGGGRARKGPCSLRLPRSIAGAAKLLAPSQPEGLEHPRLHRTRGDNSCAPQEGPRGRGACDPLPAHPKEALICSYRLSLL